MGQHLNGENNKIRFDLPSCAKVPPVELDGEMLKYLATLFSLLPTVKKLPYYNRKVAANM